MKTPQKHAEIIKAWADGATIEFRERESNDLWKVVKSPCWAPDYEYRVKPEPTLSQTAQDMVNGVVVTCAWVNHAVYNDLSDTASKENTRDIQIDMLKRYILTLEQAVLSHRSTI